MVSTMEARTVIVNFALVFFIPNISCDLNYGQPKVFTSSSVTQTLSSANGFSVSSVTNDVNGRCVTKITIYGHGINKVIDYTCTSKRLPVINLDKKLLVADEFYSENNGELVRVFAGRCRREVFHRQKTTNRYTSTITMMSIADCDRIKARIAMLKQAQRRWDEWYKKRQQMNQQQLQQVQSNLASLQQQFFTNILSMQGFGK